MLTRRHVLLAALMLTGGCAVGTPSQPYFYIDVEVVQNSSLALKLAAEQNYLGISQGLHVARVEGRIRPMLGGGNLTIDITGVVSAQFPDRTSYSLGQNPRGGTWTPVEKTGRGIRVVVPIMGADGKGRMRLRLPYAPMASGSPGVCIQADFETAYLPELMAGSHQGAANTVCGLPGRVSKIIQKSEDAVLYVLVQR